MEIEEMNLGVINIYCPPSSDTQSFEDVMEQSREWTEQRNKELVLIGDFNFPDQYNWSEADREGIRESIQGRQKGQWGRELTQAVILLEFIEENCLLQWVQEETRKENILDLLFTNSMTIRGTEIIRNSSELSDHNTVVSTFVTAEKTEAGDEPVNYHKSDIPLYNLEEIDEEGWLKLTIYCQITPG